MLTAVNQCHPFELHNPMLYFFSTTYAHPCYFLHTLVCSKNCSEDSCRHGGVSRGLVEILGICYPQSAIHVKNGA